MAELKGKIGVLIEDHFDPTEYRRFNEYFPTQGYEVEYISHLWGQPELHFGSNPEDNIVEERVTVSTEVNDINPSDYAGIILIGAYATDRLRYQVKIKKGQKNQAPAVVFLRKAMEQQAKVGTICHSMWLLCADSDLLKGRQVTCAHNIVCDVENAGGEVIYTEDDETADLVIDGNLISGKHPGMVDQFMEVFVQEIEKN
ncbi:MAG: DJ-1/PfpI family protein [Anaerolineae bacterium]|nr:DJ-1/PfpI family protein [Anaerolineae bacterium]